MYTLEMHSHTKKELFTFNVIKLAQIPLKYHDPLGIIGDHCVAVFRKSMYMKGVPMISFFVEFIPTRSPIIRPNNSLPFNTSIY